MVIYNVALTLMQRHDVALTLIRRYINIMYPLDLSSRTAHMYLYILFSLNSFTATGDNKRLFEKKNSIDPDETAHLDLRCLT